MRLVEIDDPNTLLGERNRRIRQNVLDGRDNVSYWLDLYRLDRQHIVVFVHIRIPKCPCIV